MRIRLLAALAAIGIAVAGLVGFAAPASAAGPDGGPVVSPAISCTGSQPHSLKDGSFGHTTRNSVRIRSGPSRHCVARGQAQKSQRLRYWCWTSNGSHTWTFVVDRATGKRGWIRDDLLTRFGAAVGAHC